MHFVNIKPDSFVSFNMGCKWVYEVKDLEDDEHYKRHRDHHVWLFQVLSLYLLWFCLAFTLSHGHLPHLFLFSDDTLFLYLFILCSCTLCFVIHKDTLSLLSLVYSSREKRELFIVYISYIDLKDIFTQHYTHIFIVETEHSRSSPFHSGRRVFHTCGTGL